MNLSKISFKHVDSIYQNLKNKIPPRKAYNIYICPLKCKTYFCSLTKFLYM